MPTRKPKASDLEIPIRYTADPKTRQLTVKAELANPITRQEREQLLRSMSLIYGSNEKVIIKTVKNHRLKKDTQKDSFGRYLSEVEVNGMGNLSDYLLTNNLAVPYS